MSALDIVWHVINFVAPALGVGGIAAGLTKLLWRRELRSVAWFRLSAWASAGGVATLIVGLVTFGHDGKMATYIAMTAVCALTLWWVGFGPARR